MSHHQTGKPCSNRDDSDLSLLIEIPLLNRHPVGWLCARISSKPVWMNSAILVQVPVWVIVPVLEQRTIGDRAQFLAAQRIHDLGNRHSGQLRKL